MSKKSDDSWSREYTEENGMEALNYEEQTKPGYGGAVALGIFLFLLAAAAITFAVYAIIGGKIRLDEAFTAAAIVAHLVL